MKKNIFNLLLFPSLTFAAEPCPNEAASTPKSIEVLQQLDSKVKLKELETLAKANDDKVIKYVIEPTTKTCSTVSYKIPELKMKPNESVYFHVPPEYRDRGVRFMVLGHRQDVNDGNSTEGWDNKPGLSSVQVHSKSGWSYWQGPASGKGGAKFAEVRPVAEIENLYDWDVYGHTNIKTEVNSKTALTPDAMKVTSVGADEVLLSELTLKVRPPKETSKEEIIYSEGTAFTPDSPDKKYKLSGGQAFGGLFPNAKAIKGRNQIVIPVKAGMKITSIDVACGDSHPDGVTNKDGGSGTPGWAKLSIGIMKPNGETKWLMNRENVPPEGMLMASPDDCDEKIEEGSQVVIKSDSDTTYVMGVHIGYTK